MFKTIVYVIAWIAGFLSAFRKPKPEPSKSSWVRDATLDPDAPTAFIIHGGQRKRTEEPFEPRLKEVSHDWEAPYQE